jgi:hypothetical protein
MQEDDHSADQIPVLTEMVDAGAEDAENRLPDNMETLIAELQTELAASTFALTEHLLQNALTEMEAALFEQVSARLRQELPELVDGVLRKHFGSDEESV